MNNGFKALIGTALLGFIMSGCGSSQYRDGKSCGDDCQKACCSAQACSHPNSTFSCPNCTDGKHCCGDCAAKDAAACPDCAASAKACAGCKDGIKCDSCAA